MAFEFINKLKKTFNVFRDKQKVDGYRMASSSRPDRIRMHYGNERSIVNAIYNRIALDVSALPIRHVKLNDDGQFLDYVNSDLDYCLTVESNIDQTPRMLIRDLVLTLLDEGVAALVPVDTDENLYESDSVKIYSLRVGKIRTWFPTEVEVDLYNDNTGLHDIIRISKRKAAIIENPFYTVMNEPNSILRRLVRKLNILDNIDEEHNNNKFNLIIQNPYNVKTSLRREEVSNKLEILENMLASSKYGIGYIDGAEKITQINRELNNGIMAEIEYLTKMLYSQLGMSESIMDNTADAKVQNNYLHRTLVPILHNICDAMKRTFLTKTAITQKQSIMYFSNPFDALDITNAADLADKFTRNEILSSNEIRQGLGFKPSKDPKADMLINSNLNHSPDEMGQLESGQNGFNTMQSSSWDNMDFNNPQGSEWDDMDFNNPQGGGYYDSA